MVDGDKGVFDGEMGLALFAECVPVVRYDVYVGSERLDAVGAAPLDKGFGSAYVAVGCFGRPVKFDAVWVNVGYGVVLCGR